MFCPKCGAALAEESRKCERCGYERTDPPAGNDPAPAAPELTQALSSAGSKAQEKLLAFFRNSPLLRLVFFALALLVLILSFHAAHCVATGGTYIASIESVGGKTLAEAYYQYLGTVYAGYAAMIRATGIFFASVLAHIGRKAGKTE